MTADVMRAVEHARGYVVGAYDGPRLLAASSGFVAVGADGRCRLHSHISGVLPDAQRRGVGWALKLHQRAWALQRGIETITWTFDRLVRRNAWFNLGKLGAQAVEYLVDFYGPVHDGLTAGEPSDRLFTRWDLMSPAVVAAVAARPSPSRPPAPRSCWRTAAAGRRPTRARWEAPRSLRCPWTWRSCACSARTQPAPGGWRCARHSCHCWRPVAGPPGSPAPATSSSCEQPDRRPQPRQRFAWTSYTIGRR